LLAIVATICACTCVRVCVYVCVYVCVCTCVCLTILSMFIMRLRVREIKFRAAELSTDEKDGRVEEMKQRDVERVSEGDEERLR
jgi:hypothetical protein